MANIVSIPADETDPASTPQTDVLPSQATSPSPKQRPRLDKTPRDTPAKAAGQPATSRSVSKTDLVLKKLRAVRGATIEMLMEATGWQAHSVRGFLSATVRKKLRLQLSSEVGKDGTRRYRIEDAGKGA